MKYKLFVLCLILLAMTGCQAKENPVPEPSYSNTFALVGKIAGGRGKLFPTKWKTNDSFSAVNADDWTAVGVVVDPLAEAVQSGMTLKTNAEAGSKIRVVRALGSFDGTTGKLPAVQSGAFEDHAFGYSDEIVLSSSFAKNFTFYQPMSYVCISFKAEKGSSFDGQTISGLKFTAPGNKLAGTFTLDAGKNETSPAAGDSFDCVEVKMSKGIKLSQTETTVWITVLPCDLTKTGCSIEIAGTTYTFYGVNLTPSSAFKLNLGTLGGSIAGKDLSKPEYTKTPVQYKQKVEDASWSTYKSANTISLDGMNWMDKLAGCTHDRWGGYSGVRPETITSSNPEGFWRTGKYKGHHVMVNPDGLVTIARGVNGVMPDPYKGVSSDVSKKEYNGHFLSTSEWVTFANKFLSDLGFNFFSTNPNRLRRYREIFSESDEEKMRSNSAGKQMGQVEIAFLLRTFSWDYNLVTGVSFDQTYGSVFALMFDEGYLSYIDSLAKDIAKVFKDSRNFIGYYTDNELQFRFASSGTQEIDLKQWLSLSSQNKKPRAFDNARKYAEDFITKNYHVDAVASNVTTEMNDAFLKDVSEYYYRTASEALRRHDPNHLILGSRLHGKPKSLQIVTSACAKYCDLVSVNVYGVWEPNDDYFLSQLPVWAPDKPVWVTEFYTRNAFEKYDGTLYANTGEGGGWLVQSHSDRGIHYQNFTRKLLTYDYIAGWQWFQMLDDDLSGYGWNNKGIISPKYEYYTDLATKMRQQNFNVYQILNYYFDKSAPSPSTEVVKQVIWE